jgi:hypothetical protein
MRHTLVATLLLLAPLGCGEGPQPVEPSVAYSNLQVGPGVTPTFSWDGMDAWHIWVSRVDDGEVVWRIRNETCFITIKSPVVYGSIPGHPAESLVVEPVLTEGVTYQVTVEFTCGGDARLRKTFTP